MVHKYALYTGNHILSKQVVLVAVLKFLLKSIKFHFIYEVSFIAISHQMFSMISQLMQPTKYLFRCYHH